MNVFNLQKNDPDYDPEEDDDAIYKKKMKEGKNDFKLDIESLKNKDPGELKYLSKKNSHTMLMVYFSGKRSIDQAKKLAVLWDTGLKNANLPVTL